MSRNVTLVLPNYKYLWGERTVFFTPDCMLREFSNKYLSKLVVGSIGFFQTVTINTKLSLSGGQYVHVKGSHVLLID